MHNWRRLDEKNPLEVDILKKALQNRKPKFFGKYKREITCMRIFKGLHHLPVLEISTIEGIIFVKTIAFTDERTFYPLIGHYDLNQNGKLINFEFICQNHMYLVPRLLAYPYFSDDVKVLYFKSLAKVSGNYQKNWPGFSKFPEYLFRILPSATLILTLAI